MIRHLGRIYTLACAALAWPTAALAQHGAPSRIIADQRVGSYLVSVWAAPDVGMGMVYVVYDAADGAAFVSPVAVRVGVAPISGRLPEVLYEARPERLRRGARFVAHVAFDRGDEWRIRVITQGPAGSGALSARVASRPTGGLGPMALVLYSFPFVAVVLLRWRASTVARRRASGQAPALAAP